MVDKSKAGRRDRLEHHVPGGLASIELGGLDRLEREPFEADHLQRQPVLGQDRMVIDLREIGKVIPYRFLAGGGLFTGGRHWRPTSRDWARAARAASESAKRP